MWGSDVWWIAAADWLLASSCSRDASRFSGFNKEANGAAQIFLILEKPNRHRESTLTKLTARIFFAKVQCER